MKTKIKPSREEDGSDDAHFTHSPGEIPGGSAERVFTDALLTEFRRKEWEPRLEKRVHFEKWESFYGGDLHLLFFRRQILVLADDLAQATNSANRLGPELKYAAAEIIGMVDVRDLIVVPESKVFANLGEAVGGTYVPLELLVSMFWDSGFQDDAVDFYNLLNDFEERITWQHEAALRETKLRKARLRGVDMQGLRLQKVKLQRAKVRSEKRKP